MNEQDLSCTYLAHHELESFISNFITVIIIIIIIIIINGLSSGLLPHENHVLFLAFLPLAFLALAY